MYAGKRRRRPARRNNVQPTGEVKSNPSKRHRDRLNAELDRLASLLPFDEDTVSKLDKLSILRLSVSYLRNKSFFQVAFDGNGTNCNGTSAITHHRLPEITGSNAVSSSTGNNNNVVVQTPDSGVDIEGETQMMVQALGGFIIVVQDDGQIFYATPSIQEHLGFQDADVMHQNVYELIHKDDRLDFQNQLSVDMTPPTENGTPAPENEDFEASLDRNFTCRFRCLLDESSGFLNLHITGKLRPLYGQRVRGEDGVPVDVDPPGFALFALASPLQQPSIMEIYVRNMIFRTKHKLDFKPLSLDNKGTEVLGFSEKELSSMAGYHYLHYEDIIYCSDMHSALIRKGETGFIYFRLMTKKWKWLWVQAKGRVMYKNGKPDYLLSTHRPMSDEEGEQHLNSRRDPFKFPFHGEAELYDCNPPYPPIPKAILKALGSGGPPPSGPPPGFPPGGPPDGFPSGPPPGFPPGGPPPGFPPGGPPPGFPSGGPPPGMSPPAFPGFGPTSTSKPRDTRPKLTAKRLLTNSPRKIHSPTAPPNVSIGPGLEGFKYRTPYSRASDVNQCDLNQAFQNVAVQEEIPTSCSRNRLASADSGINQPIDTSSDRNPRLQPELQSAPLDYSQPPNNSTAFNEGIVEIKKSPAQSNESNTSPLDLSMPDPGYFTDNPVPQPGSISSRSGHLSTSSVGTLDSTNAFDCGDIPYFDDSISPLTLGDMEVIPRDRPLSGSSPNSSMDSHKPPLQNSIGLSVEDVDTIDSNLKHIVEMDKRCALTFESPESMPSCAATMQDAVIKNSPPFNSTAAYPAASSHQQPTLQSFPQSSSQPMGTQTNTRYLPQNQVQQRLNPQLQQRVPSHNQLQQESMMSPAQQHRFTSQGHLQQIMTSPSQRLNSQDPSQQQSLLEQRLTSADHLQQRLAPQEQLNTTTQAGQLHNQNAGLQGMTMAPPPQQQTFKMSPGHVTDTCQNGYLPNELPNVARTTMSDQYALNNSFVNTPQLPNGQLNSCAFSYQQQANLELQEQLARQIEEEKLKEKALREQLQIQQQKALLLQQQQIQQQQQLQIQQQQKQLQQQQQMHMLRVHQQRQHMLKHQELKQQQQLQQQRRLQQQQQLQQQQMFNGGVSAAPMQWSNESYSALPNQHPMMGSDMYGMMEGETTELEIGYQPADGSKPVTFQSSKITMSTNYQPQPGVNQQPQQPFMEQPLGYNMPNADFNSMGLNPANLDMHQVGQPPQPTTQIPAHLGVS